MFILKKKINKNYLLVCLVNNYLLNSYSVPGTMPSSVKMIPKVWSVDIWGSLRPFKGLQNKKYFIIYIIYNDTKMLLLEFF